VSPQGLQLAVDKMRDAGVHSQAIDVFRDYYRQLEEGVTGFILEDSIEPLTDPELLGDVEIDDSTAQQALAATVMIKLNGGLGTSMGMDKAKSLLPVRERQSFLDIIVAQVRAARASYGVKLPLIFMNSFRTRDDTLAALAGCDDVAVDGLQLDFLQSQEPKLRADNLTPVAWPPDPTLEWCPPGHGDLYPSLVASGVLARLLGQGYRYALVSNSDNLGAAPDARIAGWFAASQAPYAAEICRRTAADRKGGHLAIRKTDGQLILRDTAQTSDAEMEFFTDEHRHPYFHTNNLWFDLQVLDRVLKERNSMLGLPLIKNVKTVDPGDPTSTKVIQIESAMGAAVEVFPGATAIGVGRERFLPVKGTNDLLLLRSDIYDVGEDGRLRRTTHDVPRIELAGKYYKTIAAFEQRLAAGAPSLRECRTLTVLGDWTFEPGVRLIGDVVLADNGQPQRLQAGVTVEGRA
jgi:UTP--glucose-1-phosphate uridylyltransferase